MYKIVRKKSKPNHQWPLSITWHTPIIIFLFTLLQKKKDILNCSCRPCLEVINQVLDLLQTKTAFILIFLKYKGWQIEIDSKVSREQLITDVMQFWGFWKIASAKHVDFFFNSEPHYPATLFRVFKWSITILNNVLSVSSEMAK